MGGCWPPPAHHDKAAMNGAQLPVAHGDPSGLMTGPPAEGWGTRRIPAAYRKGPGLKPASYYASVHGPEGPCSLRLVAPLYAKKRRPRRGKKSLGRIGSGVHLLRLRSSQFPHSEPRTHGPKRMAEMLVERVGLLATTGNRSSLKLLRRRSYRSPANLHDRPKDQAHRAKFGIGPGIGTAFKDLAESLLDSFLFQRFSLIALHCGIVARPLNWAKLTVLPCQRGSSTV